MNYNGRLLQNKNNKGHQRWKLQKSLKNQLDLKGRDGVVFVDYEHGFIGASPDYLVIMPCGKRALLEIKCPETSKNLGIGDKEPKKD